MNQWIYCLQAIVLAFAIPFVIVLGGGLAIAISAWVFDKLADY